MAGRLITKYQAVILVVDTESIGRFTVQRLPGCGDVHEQFRVDAAEPLQLQWMVFVIAPGEYFIQAVLTQMKLDTGP